MAGRVAASHPQKQNTAPPNTQEAPSFCYLTSFPHELVLRLFFEFRSAKDVISLGSTSKILYPISTDDHIWKSLLDQHFPHVEISTDTQYLSLYREQSLRHRKPLLKRNLDKGTYNYHCFKANANCFTMAEGYLFTGHRGHFKIWDIHTEKCLYTLNAKRSHDNVCDIQYIEGRLFVMELSVINYTVTAWDCKTGACLQTLFCTHYSSTAVGRSVFLQVADSRLFIWDILHTSLLVFDCKTLDLIYKFDNLAITDFKIIDHHLFTTSFNQVKIWDFNTGICLHTFTGHTDAISFFKVAGNRLVTVAEDDTANVWDIENEISLCTRPCAVSRFDKPDEFLFIADDRLFLIIDENTIEALNINTCESLYKITENIPSHAKLKIAHDRLIKVSTGNFSTTFEVWNTANGQCMPSFNTHYMGDIQFMTIAEDHLFAFFDGFWDEIKVWSFQKNKWVYSLSCKKQGCGYYPGMYFVEGCLLTYERVSKYEAIKIWDFHSLPLPTHSCTIM